MYLASAYLTAGKWACEIPEDRCWCWSSRHCLPSEKFVLEIEQRPHLSRLYKLGYTTKALAFFEGNAFHWALLRAERLLSEARQCMPPATAVQSIATLFKNWGLS